MAYYMMYDNEEKEIDFDITSIGKNGKVYSIHDEKGYWISKDGSKRYPNQFDYKHLINTIRMIERKIAPYGIEPSAFKIYNLLKMELKLRESREEHMQ